MKRLNTLWSLAIGIALGSLLVLTLIQFTGRMSTFLMWLTLFAIGASLTFYTVRVRQPQKKKLPVRRASRVSKPRNLKVVRR